MSRALRCSVLVLSCTAACSAAPLNLGFGVAVTATFDSSVDDAALATVTQIVVSATGDETYSGDDPLMRAAHRTEELVYRPLLDTRHITLTVIAEDASGAEVAQGSSAELELVAGKTSRVEIELFPGTSKTDGGSPDLSHDDASSMFPTCAGLGYELCEDFEQGISSTWSPDVSGGTVAADSTYAHSGTESLHVHLPAVMACDYTYAWLSETDTVTVPNTDFHARAFVLFPTALPPALFPMMVVQQNASPFDLMELEISEGHPAMYDAFATAPGYAQSTTTFPSPGWTCVEWYVHLGSPGTLTFSIDGHPVSGAELDGTTNASPPLGILLFGGQQGSGSSAVPFPAFDFWLGDLVVPNPIGCAD